MKSYHTKREYIKSLGLQGFFGVILAMFITTEAFANLIINPTRVVFDDSDRTQSVTIINSGNQPQTYRLKFVEKVQSNQGGYTNLDESANASLDQFQASPMLRYSPRQITLQPNEKQRVRISLRKPANLRAGEYRSHLMFQILPKAEQINLNQENAGFKIFMLQSFSIPVQVRVGQPQVIAQIQSPQIRAIDNQKNAVQFTLNKSGNYSAFGSVKVFWKPNAGAQFQPVGELNNVAVYRESSQISVSVTLQTPPKTGIYKIDFLADKFFKQKVFDSMEFTVN